MGVPFLHFSHFYVLVSVLFFNVNYSYSRPNIHLRLWDTEVGMVSGQDGPTLGGYVRLQLQNMEDESRGKTQTCTARSNERSLTSGRAPVVKARKLSRQILLPQTT